MRLPTCVGLLLWPGVRLASAPALVQLGTAGDANAQLRAVKTTLATAELNLEFTRVSAPVKGYVTYLNLRKGSQAAASQPSLALVDVNSYWVFGFFRERGSVMRVPARDVGSQGNAPGRRT